MRLETYCRRDNLKFFRILEAKGKTSADCEQKVIQAIQNAGLGEIQPRALVRAHRAGATTRSSNQRPKPILVCFSHYKDREYILNNGKLLRQAGTPVAEDYPEDIERHRQILTPIFWSIFNFTVNGHSYSYRTRVKLVYDHVIFNGMAITVENLNKLLSQFEPDVRATPSKQGITTFYSEASPLFNHYQCKFIMGKWTYNCGAEVLSTESIGNGR